MKFSRTFLIASVLIFLMAATSAFGASRKPSRPSRPAPARHSTLEDWRLDDRFRPSVTLRLNNGRRVTLVFDRDGSRLILQDKQEPIPEGTRFTVPQNYMAYCNYYHTELVSGRASRVEDGNGVLMTQYEQGSTVSYIRPSGLIMVSYADIAASNFRASTVPEETFTGEKEGEGKHDDNDDDDDDDDRYRPDPHDFENRSVKPEDVVKKYDLPDDVKASIIHRHKEAQKLLSRKERLEVYSRIFRDHREDYLAAYYAALAEFEMGHGPRSMEWCDRALEINPLYLPAKQLRKRAEGLTKKVG
ncbi:MAG: hypothetical protein IJG65_00725 [Synergistaceae bacterium]|nr:hypothetical protein [Synergistaceae bacterium]